jgi:peptide/nickel transport system substrate-binding protein
MMRRAFRVKRITRRDFLRTSALGAAGALLYACAPEAAPTEEPEAPPTTVPEEPTATSAPEPEPTEPPPPTEAPEPTPAPTVAKAQEVKFLVGQNFFGDMNPYSNWITASAEVTHHIYDGLVKWDDKQANIIGDLAESWELEDDNTWIFNLKQGVTFQDGTEFTADSVKYSLEEIQVGERGWAFSSLFSVPMEIEAVDKYTAKVVTETPYSCLLPNLTIVGMLNPEQTKEEIDTAPVGTGPFKFVSREGNTIAVEAFEDYWRGKPEISQITFDYVEDPITRITALRSGQAQIAERIPVDHVSELEDDPATKVITAPTNEIVRWVARPTGPMGDKKFREALWHAVDRQALIDAFLEGVFPVATAPCAEPVFGYPPDLPPLPYDPKKAEELLAESTYDGSEIELVGPAGYHPKNAEIMQAVANMVAPVGINLKADPMEVGAFIDKVMDPEYTGLIYASWVSWTGDSDFVIGFLWYGGGSLQEYDSPELDAMFEESRLIMDQDERKAKLQEAYHFLWEDRQGVYFYETTQVVGMAKNLEKWPTPPTMLLVAEPDTHLA